MGRVERPAEQADARRAGAPGRLAAERPPHGHAEADTSQGRTWPLPCTAYL
jgi:hypothetical protein